MKKDHAIRAVSFFVCFLGALIFLSVLWLQDKFGIVSMDAIVFHLNHPLERTPAEYPLSYLKRVVGGLLVSGLWAYGFRLKIFGPRTALRTALWGLPPLLLVGSMFFAVRQFEVIDYLHGRGQKNTFIEEHYLPIRLEELTFPEKKRNVVVLFLESMRSDFASEKLFPKPLIPKLKKIQNENISCDLAAAPGLTWTVASLTGFLFGVPLRLPVRGNHYSRTDDLFLPGALSLLEVFEANGYKVSLIAGSDTNFAGTDNIFLNHLDQAGIYDLRYFEELGETADGPWGLRDRRLYERARELIAQMSREETPFVVIIQSIDTHSEAKAYGDYPQPFGDARDAFVAADHMAADFLQWLTAQDFYSDTTVFIAGDHLYMDDELGPVKVLENSSPFIYNAFLNTVLDGGAQPDHRRAATMLDMGPSLLEAIGVELPRGGYGLGRSIFSRQPTLIEQYSLEELDVLAEGQSLFYEKFFQPPQPFRPAAAPRAGSDVTEDRLGRKDSPAYDEILSPPIID